MNLCVVTEEEGVGFSDEKWRVMSCDQCLYDDDDDDDVVVIQAPFYTLTGDFSQKIFTVVDAVAVSQGAKHTHLALHAIIKGFRGL